MFYDRISFSLSYLNLAGLLEKPGRGLFKISTIGFQFLEEPEKLTSFVEKEVQKNYKLKKALVTSPIDLEESKTESLTPQEKLFNSFNKIRDALILAQVLAPQVDATD
ncbi:winged helix-turn-helix domain-containing protein [Pedobacter sp. WC2501]|uniref:winged helix-turn-helix domain-containing protein n=1 Tax=Pedobacter sp. WC2501 TaxID=3461400 RepID=UPI00404608DF